MIHHNLPRDFRNKVRNYLDYLVDYKKKFKLEEEEVYGMLNEGLILELIINMNGKMLHKTPIFKHFELEFLSELTFSLKKETFSTNDHIFNEGDEGSSVYFIIKGSIYIVHKKS